MRLQPSPEGQPAAIAMPESSLRSPGRVDEPTNDKELLDPRRPGDNQLDNDRTSRPNQSLLDKLEQLKRVRDELAKHRRLAELRAEIEELETNPAGIKRNASEASPTHVVRYSEGPPIESIPYYEGKSMRELEQWVWSSRTVFLLAPDYFTTDSRKILYTMQYLKGAPRRSWYCYENDHPVDAITWDTYVEYLKNLIRGSMNSKRNAQLYHHPARLATPALDERMTSNSQGSWQHGPKRARGRARPRPRRRKAT